MWQHDRVNLAQRNLKHKSLPFSKHRFQMSFKWKPLVHNTRNLVTIWVEEFSFPQGKYTYTHPLQTPQIVWYYDKPLRVKNNPFTTLKCKGNAKEALWKYNSPKDWRTQKVREPSWKHYDLHVSCLLYFLITLVIYSLILVRNLKLSWQHPLLE